MAAIRGKHTKPERIIRRGLHARGFRYRLHAKNLPGRPDLVLPKHRALIDIRSCFFHGHDCYLFRLPQKDRAFWAAKIAGNVERDGRTQAAQLAMGWRVAVVWECSLRGRMKLGEVKVIEMLSYWLLSEERDQVIRGSGTPDLTGAPPSRNSQESG